MLAHYDDSTGQILGFYDPDVHGENIPSPTVPIEDTDWHDHLTGTAKKGVSGGVLVDWVRPVVPRDDQATTANARIGAVHANLLRVATGDATTEERDTWKIQEEAARALDDGVATAGQTSMIDDLAAGAGVTNAEMAAIILAKADAFIALIGAAGKIRAKYRAQVEAAVSDAALSDDEVADALATAMAALNTEADAFLAALV